MAPTTATPRKGGRPAKSAAANSTFPDASPQTPSSSLKQKLSQRIPWYSPESTLMSTTTFYRRIELLNDLSCFCGVGSLEIPMPRRAAIGGEAPDGWLWLETPGPAYKTSKFSIEASLIGLIDCCVVRCTYHMVQASVARVRVYVLPDDVGRSVILRGHENLRKWLNVVMSAVDVSLHGWKGQTWRCSKSIWGPSEDRPSLSEIFNNLESPKPDPESPWIKDENTRELLRDVLSKENKIPGMRAKLYDYQKRSVAMMLQKELVSDKIEDPRLNLVAGPRGEKYYLDFETMEIFECPRYYEDVRGGILAEEMGTGKTLICLAVILASKHQISYIPDEYVSIPLRRSVASLSDMCVSAIWRNALPWTQFLDGMPENCIKMIMNNRGSYDIPPTRRSRSSRYAYDDDAMEKIYLGAGTIIVCPQNLVSQWEDEIEKHIEKGALKVLKLIDNEKIPSVLKLLNYDVVIISRPCFDKEAREGRDNHGRTEAYGVRRSCCCMYIGATRTRDCVCFTKEGVYKSPLMSIHWKRIIVDEGHSMASSPSGPKSNGVCVAEKLPVERRWIVTGTPTSLLVGVAPETVEYETEEELKKRAERELDEQGERQGEEAQHLDRVGRMVCDFLKQKPWAPMDDRWNTEKASWKRYISKAFINKRAGSTERVRSIFHHLFVRHRIDTINEEAPLPPLKIKLVKLVPGFFEKVSMNLIVGAIKANEVTSERTGLDYLFNPANRGHLKVLKNNLLGRSGFYPSGYTVSEVESTVKLSRKYLEENGMRCEEEDIQLLLKVIRAGEMALKTRMWRNISTFQVMVYFLSGFPEDLAPAWSFSTWGEGSLSDTDATLLEIDGVKLQHLQKNVNAHAHEFGFDHKLESLGKAFDFARQQDLLAKPSRGPQKGVTRPSTNARPLTINRTISNNSTASTALKTLPKSALKTSKAISILPPGSPLAKVEIIGTPSAKLTYLMNKIVAHHKTEKILVFYEMEDVAGYIAQALEIFGVDSLWYSGNISLKKRTEHLECFQHSERFRVLLMNLKHAAHGLNISCASRLFFVSPVWQRDIEQQAIKRAYRIGQKKEVYVETLILADTAEEEMWKRSKEMTQKERNDAKDSLKDSGMRDIIKNLQFLKVELSDGDGVRKAIVLDRPESVFGEGKHGGVYDDIQIIRPSAIASTTTPPSYGPSKTIASPIVSAPVSGPDERVTSDLSTRVNWADASREASSASSRKRKLSDTPSVASPQERAGSSRPVKRGKRVGFTVNNNKDWMEDSDDDFEAPSAGKGKGKGKGKVTLDNR